MFIALKNKVPANSRHLKIFIKKQKNYFFLNFLFLLKLLP